MFAKSLAHVMLLVVISAAVCLLTGGCPGGVQEPTQSPAPDTLPDSDDATGTPDDDAGDADDGGVGADDGGAEDGTAALRIRAYTNTLGAAADDGQSAQQAPDDVDVNLTPMAYTIAFKRLVLKQVDDVTHETLAAVEVFRADAIGDALVVDLANAEAADLLDVESLAPGTYNKVDIEVFYLDMTIPTLFPETASHDIGYRMVFETMGVLEPRDFLLHLEPAWMEAGSDLATQVIEAGWYWMEMGVPDHVVAVEGASGHPTFPVLDLFANETFWSSEHKVLEGGWINPPLEYDALSGAVLTITFDVTGTFNFKDYHDETVEPDGLWEIRRDAGIHPFPPNFECTPGEVASL